MRAAQARAQRLLAEQRRRTPALQANRSRNARAEIGRWRQWTPLRAESWSVVDQHLRHDARVAVVGVGNGDTLPLEQIAARAARLALIDLDGDAIKTARARLPRRLRHRSHAITHDVTNGSADSIARHTAAREVPEPPRLLESPLPGAPYDLVIGDLLYSQLLYPALVDLQVPSARRAAVVGRYGPLLTRALVCRMHASAPDGHVLHIHGPVGWWPGHPQTIDLDRLLAVARHDPRSALAACTAAIGPRDSDPRPALRHFGIPIRDTRLWRWPFAPGVDYLVCATLAGALTPA